MINNGAFTGHIIADLGVRDLHNSGAGGPAGNVELQYRIFSGLATGKSEAHLIWVTENEKENNRFEVERSFDESNFSTVALVFGHEANSQHSNAYNFIDKSKEIRKHKVVYYRLKQVDFSGNFYYSDVTSVTFPSGTKGDNGLSVKIFPDSLKQFLNINFNAPRDAAATVLLVSANGELADSEEALAKKGWNNAKLVFSSLKKGIYMLSVIIDRKLMYTQKLMNE